MRFITAEQINELSKPQQLIEELKHGFQSETIAPSRHHHSYSPESSTKDSTLLLMPAWQTDKTLGVKVVTVSPENRKLSLPSIHGVYLLFDTKTGVPLAQLDGTALTLKRTAAASALASSLLSRPDSDTLLMVGTGALAPELIKAHCTVRPINRVLIWGRNLDKAMKVKSHSNEESLNIEVVESLDEAVPKACVISCATLSEEPLIKGDLCHPGQHIDLVGAYLPTMRESDSELIAKADVYVDTQQGMMESGDIAIPFNEGIIDESSIQGDLYSLVRGTKNQRNPDSITVFKSVGHALEDMVAANYLYNKIQ